MICVRKSLSQPWEYIKSSSGRGIWNKQEIHKKNTISVFLRFIAINPLSGCPSVRLSSVHPEKGVCCCGRRLYETVVFVFLDIKRYKKDADKGPIVLQWHHFKMGAEKVVSSPLGLRIHRGSWPNMSRSLLRNAIQLIAFSFSIMSLK